MLPSTTRETLPRTKQTTCRLEMATRPSFPKEKAPMTTTTVTGLYDSYDAAAQTVRDLEAAHIPYADISMVAHRSDAYVASGPAPSAPPGPPPPGAATGAEAGASAGAALGGGAGLLAGLGMLAIPGI